MLNNFNSSVSTDPKDDPLASGPPLPSDRGPLTGKGKPSRSSIPEASEANADRAAKAAHLLGLGPAMDMARGMMNIEKIVRQLSRSSPILQQIFAPAIAQARDVAASSLANMSAGGLGNSETGIGAPPPGSAPPGPQPGPAAPSPLGPNMAGPGGGVGGMAPMPAPMPPQ